MAVKDFVLIALFKRTTPGPRTEQIRFYSNMGGHFATYNINYAQMYLLHLEQALSDGLNTFYLTNLLYWSQCLKSQVMVWCHRFGVMVVRQRGTGNFLKY